MTNIKALFILIISLVALFLTPINHASMSSHSQNLASSSKSVNVAICALRKSSVAQNPCLVWLVISQESASDVGVNWYSYTSNPIMYTDPSGYQFIVPYNMDISGIVANAKANGPAFTPAEIVREISSLNPFIDAGYNLDDLRRAETTFDKISSGVSLLMCAAPGLPSGIQKRFGDGVAYTAEYFGKMFRKADNVVPDTKYFRDKQGRLRNENGSYAYDGSSKKVTNKSNHGNIAGDQPATLYERYDSDGNFLKHGISQNPNTRYTKKELNGGFLIETQTGPRKDILNIERNLVETSPGPLNREPWAGSRKGE